MIDPGTNQPPLSPPRPRLRRWHHTVAVTLSIAVVLAAFASGCSSDEKVASAPQHARGSNVTIAPAGEPIRGGLLSIGLSAETNGWNPVSAQWGSQGYQVARAIFDPLAAFDKDNRVRPYLAKAFESNADFTQWKIVLRPGISFHDGTALDAAALKKNIDAHRGSITTGQAMAPVTSVDVVDPLAVNLTMKEPWSSFPGYLTAQFGFVAAPAMLDDPEGMRNPIGTGPFVFESWRPDNDLKVKRNERYWQAGLPYLDNITFEVIQDNQARTNAFRADDVQIAELTVAGRIAEGDTIAQEGKAQFLTDSRGNNPEIVLPLNTATEPFNDLVARQAVAAAINSEALSTDVFEGVFEPVSGPLAAGSPNRVETAYPKPDPVRARELAQDYQARHGKPLSFTVISPPDPALNQVAQFVQQQLQAAGIEMQIRSVEQASMMSAVFTGQFQAAGWIGFGGQDVEGANIFLDGRNVRPPGQLSLNMTHIDDPAITDALKQIRSSTDPATIKEANAIVQRRLGELVPYVYLIRLTSALLVKNDVRGVGDTALPDGSAAALDGSVTWLTRAWIQT